jgi:uncharacterized damage-inducible protein DinB
MIPYGAPELAAAFRTVRGNTITIAEEIPESDYGFVPAPGARSVTRLLTHIAVAPRMQLDIHRTHRLTTFDGYNYFGMRGQLLAEEERARPKSELLALLTVEGEHFATWLASLDDAFLAELVVQPGLTPRSRFEGILSAKEHEMHHRGQLMLIQRMLGIVPHLTRTANERREAMRQRALAGSGAAV